MLKKRIEFFNTRMSLLNKSLQVLNLLFAFVLLARWPIWSLMKVNINNLPIKKEEKNKHVQILTMSCCRTYSNTQIIIMIKFM